MPYSATGPSLPYFGAQNPNSDAETQMASMGSVGTLFAVVTALANNTSRVNWRLWRKAASGEKDDRVEVTSHAALDVWRKPNPFMPRQEFVETFQQHIDLTGEGWWVVARAPISPLPLELWPVRPDRIEPVPHPTKFISGYIYMSPDGGRIPLRTNEVIQLRMPNPLDVYRGMGPVQAILADLDADRYSSEWNRNFFLNSSSPGGIIEVDKRLEDDEFDELRQRWAEQHRGVAAAHRVALIEAGMKWVERSFSQSDMQFAELRNVSRDMIRGAFGMPKFAVGDVDDVNRASAEASAIWFAANMEVPRLERIKGALNEEFLPLYGESTIDLEFDYDNPIPDDEETDAKIKVSRATAAKTLVDAGYDPAEVLEVVGLPEILHIGKPAAPASPPPTAPREREEEGAPEGEPPEATPTRQGGSPEEEGQEEEALLRLVRLWNEDVGAVVTREDWEDRLETLKEIWEREVLDPQREDLVSQIVAIVEDGKPADLADISTSPDRGAELLAITLNDQAVDAAYRMANAAADQGVSITPVVPIEPPARHQNSHRTLKDANPLKFRISKGLAADLSAAAKVAATNLARNLASSAAGEAMRVWSPSSTSSEVGSKVRSFLDTLSIASVVRVLGAAIWSGENEGRHATLQQAEDDSKGPLYYEADEVRDTNTCQPCKDIDGSRFDSLDAVRVAYPSSGYVDCKGLSACRGTFVPYWG